MRPASTPVGLKLARAARDVGRAFDDALAEAGGSIPVWLVLLNVKLSGAANQRQLAASIGVTEATLTHHLNAMETAGLLLRRRDERNRRIHVVELTESGEAAFVRLGEAAQEFDRRLRRGIPREELDQFERLLGRLAANAGGGDGPAPWAGLANQVSPAQ